MSIKHAATCDVCGTEGWARPRTDPSGHVEWMAPRDWIEISSINPEDEEHESNMLCSWDCMARFVNERGGLAAAANLFRQIESWAYTTFPKSDDHAKLTHLQRELDELKVTPDSGEEIADIVMILCHLAGAHALDIATEIARKFEIVKRRKWGPADADGVVEHLRDGVPS